MRRWTKVFFRCEKDRDPGSCCLFFSILHNHLRFLWYRCDWEFAVWCLGKSRRANYEIDINWREDKLLRRDVKILLCQLNDMRASRRKVALCLQKITDHEILLISNRNDCNFSCFLQKKFGNNAEWSRHRHNCKSKIWRFLYEWTLGNRFGASKDLS